MPVPFDKLYAKALNYIDCIDPETGKPLGLDGALWIADVLLDVPSDEEIAELCREAEAEKPEPLSGDEMPF